MKSSEGWLTKLKGRVKRQREYCTVVRKIGSKKGVGEGWILTEIEDIRRVSGGGRWRILRSRPSDNVNHFPLKLPLPRAVFRSKSNLPCRALCHVYLRGSNGPAKKGFGLVTSLGWGKFRVQRVGENKPEFSFELTAKQGSKFSLVVP